MVLAAFTFFIGGGGLYYISIYIKSDVFCGVSRTLMLFLMAFVTKQFKVSPVKSDRRVVDVRWHDVLLVMDDVTRTTAALADAML